MKLHKRFFGSSTAGFTIVELLIVIIVIGILAALVIVSYSGIQSQARTSNAVSIVSTYKKAMISYAAAYGDYPDVNYWACLGTGYGDLSGDGLGNECHVNAGGDYSSEQTDFNNDLREFMGNPPKVNFRTHQEGTVVVAIGGGFYYEDSDLNVGGEPMHHWLVYFIEGNSCPLGPVYGDDWPGLTLRPDYSWTVAPNIIECWTPLPQL